MAATGKRAIALGKNVDSWCTRCKLMLAHTVEAISDGVPTRVHCNTCGAQHAYRPGPPGEKGAGTEKAAGTKKAAKSSASPRRAAPRKSAKEPPGPADYARLLDRCDRSTSRRYEVSARFAPSQVLEHPVFGTGIVLAERVPDKIDVLFADGMRTLIHRR